MSAAGMQGIDLVLFDLDGTLVETAPEIHDAVGDTLRALGLPGVPLARVEAWIGHGTGQLLASALAEVTHDTTARVMASSLWRIAQPRFALDYERRCGTSSRPYPQARELLAALGARGVRRALVTNKERRFTDAVLERHGLTTLLDRVVCGDTLPTRKPDPAGVLECLRVFDVPAHRAVFVGDSWIDVATARNAGVAAWAVSHGYNMGRPIAAAEPDRLFDALEPLLEIAP
jgi:phosphoglycolate phosphatase